MLRLVFKVLFKACLPLVAMVGFLSYGLYMKGGDPAGLASKVFGNMLSDMKSTASDATQSAKSLTPAMPGAASASHTQVYKWVDENGVTHFGSNAPDNGVASKVTINNNANVVASVRDRRQPEVTETASGQPLVEGLPPGGLPGAAGMQLPGGLTPADFAELMQGGNRP